MGARPPTRLICSFVLTTFTAIAGAQLPSSPASSALRFFDAHAAPDADALLRDLRPAHVGPK
jgi:hypothetical protein